MYNTNKELRTSAYLLPRCRLCHIKLGTAKRVINNSFVPVAQLCASGISVPANKRTNDLSGVPVAWARLADEYQSSSVGTRLNIQAFVAYLHVIIIITFIFIIIIKSRLYRGIEVHMHWPPV